MIKNKLFAFVILLMTACSVDPEGGILPPNSGELRGIQKIVNTPTSAVKGSLIVHFENDAILAIERTTRTAQVTRSAVTRSSIPSFDDVLSTIKIRSMERLYPLNERTEERTRAAGLHKWYVIYFDNSEELMATAQKLASVSVVKCVQFNNTAELNSNFKTVPFSKTKSFTTKSAINYPFNDPMLPSQWHYINDGNKELTPTCRAGADINAGEAWKITAGIPQIIVAVIDEGVKYTHPDLAANMWVNQKELNGIKGVDDDGNGYIDDIHGYNFATSGDISWTFPHPDGKGDIGHGTHVAGTVAAVNNNGIGVSGVAGGTNNNDGVRIMSCQVISGDPKAQKANTVVMSRAIKYAADMGASIIQASIGWDAENFKSDDAYQNKTPAEIAALNYFISTSNCDAIDGGLAIYAAGNETKSMVGYPSAYRKCISVTSIGPDYLPAYYTNYGSGANIAAPGGDFRIGNKCGVLSTLPSELNKGDDYGYMQGTSMACPHVSGVAALGLSYALANGKHFTNNEFKSMLLTSVNDIEGYLVGTKQANVLMDLTVYRLKMGSGAIDAFQLLMQIEGTPCLRVKVGAGNQLSLNKYFGGSATTLTYTDVVISKENMEKLGITEKPTIRDGKLSFKCTKSGVAKIAITAIAGGDTIGTGTIMGGMEVTKHIAIIAREVQAANGGWL